MLSEDINQLRGQVAWYHGRGILHSIGDLIVERLAALEDRARALEATVVPEAARFISDSDVVTVLDQARRRRARQC